MNIQFGMIVLYTRDLDRCIDFYRQLGLDIPDPRPDRPVATYRMPSGVTIIFTTEEIARRYDKRWTRPNDRNGYQQVMEFVVNDDADVDTLWNTLTAAGHHGRTAPAHINGPYAAMIDDPDGNAVLISSDRATLARTADHPSTGEGHHA